MGNIIPRLAVGLVRLDDSSHPIDVRGPECRSWVGATDSYFHAGRLKVFEASIRNDDSVLVLHLER